MIKKQSSKEINFPSGPKTIILNNVDEDTWFHLLGTFDTRIDYFEQRLKEVKQFKEYSKSIEHYEWIIKRHKEIKESIRSQIFDS